MSKRRLHKRYGRARKVKLFPVREIPAYAVIIRAIHERGKTQTEALAELSRRGLWLDPEQRRQAGLTKKEFAR
jgi:hypothetical protein